MIPQTKSKKDPTKMKVLLSFKYLFLFLSYASLAIPPYTCQGHPIQQFKNHVPFFIFGDSLFDPGNNNFINTSTDYQANFFPYGETFFKYPTGRFSNGRLIPDFIAEYAKLPLVPAYLSPSFQYAWGANFASGGAGALVETRPGFVVDLKKQLSYFKEVAKVLRQEQGDAKAKKILGSAVYLLSIGGNDYITYFTNSTVLTSYSTSPYVDMVTGNLTSVIKEIYKKGGRKFGLVNLVPLGCLPNTRESTGECAKGATELTKLHNKALPKALQKLESQLQGFKYSITDLYTALNDRIENPLTYGFKEGKVACCGKGPYGEVYSCGGKRGEVEYQLCSNPSKYVFFDSFHPTESVYLQFAELMWKGHPNVTWPFSLEALFQI